MTPAGEASSEAHSRRAFVTKAVTAAGIAWAAPVIATINQPAAAAHTLPILVSGINFVEIAPPASVATMESDTQIFGFAENCITTPAGGVTVNRSGADGGFAGNGGTYTVPAGIEVCSYFIRSERLTPGTIFATVQFTNATIVGLAYETPQLNSTRSLFGVTGVGYGSDPLEDNDTGQIITDVATGDSIAILSLTTNGTGADIIRILVVPS